jgi:sporulation protein YlmC with PRC-barrel domain
VSGTPPVTAPPGGPVAGERAKELKEAEEQARSSHLHSSDEVIGYRVVATDGTVGHLKDFVIDEADWAITDVIIDPRDWLPGQHVQVPVGAVIEVDWLTREVRLQTARAEVQEAPRA